MIEPGGRARASPRYGKGATEGATLDADDFAAQVAGHYARLVRAVTVVCGDRGLAEDAVQEALVRAWERLDAGVTLRSLPDWVAVVAMNHTRSTFRRRSAEGRARERLAARPAPGGDRSHEDVDGAAAVHALLAELPRRQREVAALHYVLDLDVATVADHLGLSDGAVKNALFHARARLRAAVGQDGGIAAAPGGTGPSAAADATPGEPGSTIRGADHG